MPKGYTYAERKHEISCGHRVVGHENKCAHLHGHNYGFTFYCEGELDAIGRVLDFSVIKSTLCQWLEDNWDHKFLAWEEDPLMKAVYYSIAGNVEFCYAKSFQESVVWVPFNPTAENMAEYMVRAIGPHLLPENILLVKCTVQETSKCSASYEIM